MTANRRKKRESQRMNQSNFRPNRTNKWKKEYLCIIASKLESRVLLIVVISKLMAVGCCTRRVIVFNQKSSEKRRKRMICNASM